MQVNGKGPILREKKESSLLLSSVFVLVLSRKRVTWAGKGCAEFAKLALLTEAHYHPLAQRWTLSILLVPFSKP